MLFASVRLAFWRASTYSRLVKAAALLLYLAALLLFFGFLVQRPEAADEAHVRRSLPATTPTAAESKSAIGARTAPSLAKDRIDDRPSALRHRRID